MRTLTSAEASLIVLATPARASPHHYSSRAPARKSRAACNSNGTIGGADCGTYDELG